MCEPGRSSRAGGWRAALDRFTLWAFNPPEVMLRVARHDFGHRAPDGRAGGPGAGRGGGRAEGRAGPRAVRDRAGADGARSPARSR